MEKKRVRAGDALMYGVPNSGEGTVLKYFLVIVSNKTVSACTQ